MTDAELRLIASAAIIGDSSQPVNGFSRPAASHDDPQPAGLERSQRLGSAGLDRIGDGEQSCKLAEIEQRLADMRSALQQLVMACESGDADLPCPIVEAFSGIANVPSL